MFKDEVRSSLPFVEVVTRAPYQYKGAGMMASSALSRNACLDGARRASGVWFDAAAEMDNQRVSSKRRKLPTRRTEAGSTAYDISK